MINKKQGKKQASKQLSLFSYSESSPNHLLPSQTARKRKEPPTNDDESGEENIMEENEWGDK